MFSIGGSGIDTVDGRADVAAGTIYFTHVATVSLNGGPSARTFDVTNWHGTGTLFGGGGVNTLVAANLTAATLTDGQLARAGAGNLALVAITQATLTTAPAGNATVNASGFSFTTALFGQGGSNTLTANGTADNQVYGGPGRNLLVGSDGGHDTITTAGTNSHVYTPAGTTAVHAESGNANIYAAGTGDAVFAAATDVTLHPAAAGPRSTSPTVGTADPITDLGLPAGVTANLLTNPTFTSGLAGWSANTGATTVATAGFDAGGYFTARPVASGLVEQTVSLTGAGYSATQLDGQTLVVTFGGRVQSAADAIADPGKLVVTFLDAGGNAIGTADAVPVANVTDRWELLGDRVHVPVGVRSVRFPFESLRQSGTTSDASLDAAFLRVSSDSTAPDIGGYDNTAAELAAARDQRIQLLSPDLYPN